MQIKKLNDCIDTLKEDLGKSLLIVDIWSDSEGMTIAGYGAKAGSAAKENKAFHELDQSFVEMRIPRLGKYLLFDLQGGSKLVLVPMHDYGAAITIDKDVQLGLFLHVMLPGFIHKFEEAVNA